MRLGIANLVDLAGRVRQATPDRHGRRLMAVDGNGCSAIRIATSSTLSARRLEDHSPNAAHHLLARRKTIRHSRAAKPDCRGTVRNGGRTGPGQLACSRTPPSARHRNHSQKSRFSLAAESIYGCDCSGRPTMRAIVATIILLTLTAAQDSAQPSIEGRRKSPAGTASSRSHRAEAAGAAPSPGRARRPSRLPPGYGMQLVGTQLLTDLRQDPDGRWHGNCSFRTRTCGSPPNSNWSALSN